jgi:hypothetical protein
MGLREVGFYRELRHGHPNGPTLTDAVRSGSHPYEREMVRYLTAAATLAAAAGPLVDDVLDPTNEGVAPLEIATDGIWVWPRDLAYYLQTYHVELPGEFLAHMRQHNWTPPALTAAELEKVAHG